MRFRLLLSGVFLLLCVAAGDLFASDPPVALAPAVVLDPLSKDGVKSDVRFWGQAAKDGVIDLTAANGFFDRCFEALEEGESSDGEKRFIVPSFGYLKRMSDKVAGTARWHLWVSEPGEVRATFFLTVPKAEAGHEWAIRLGD